MLRSLSYSPSWDLSTIPDEEFAAEWRRRRAVTASAMRETFGAGSGRPRRTDVERCPCAVMTLTRAQARGKSYEHDPSCAYYPDAPRALVV